MRNPRVLLVDLKGRPCEHPNCPGIRRLLKESNVIFDERSGPTGTGPPPDCMVLRGCGAQLLRFLEAGKSQTPLLGVFCPSAAVAEISAALAGGVNDFVCCPFSESEFILRLTGILPRHADPDPLSRGRQLRDEYQITTLIGESEALLETIAKLPRMAASDANCLLSGESGTGKELCARAIHYMSCRHRKPFVAVNCGALPDHLLENELFGHSRGAYTDASCAADGLIAAANTGTVFLDEVDTLSLAAQAKLLRFIQEHEYRPLGSSRTVRADVRVLAATNADLRRRSEQRLFREDLFYRLNVLHVHIPPLRDRAGDIPLLSQHFLQRYNSQYARDIVGFSRAALHRLISYSWPGNVRELEGVVQRAVILSTSCVIRPEDIELPAFADATHSEGTLRNAKASALQRFERAYLMTLLVEHEGNVSRAAKAAGKERRAFQRLLKKYSVDRVQFLTKTG